MGTNFYVDNRYGNDAYDGRYYYNGPGYDPGNNHGPWKTLAKASAAASYGGASTPWTIDIANNGWGYPYLENTVANGMIYPDWSGADANNYTVWNCNFAPMMPATEITDLTWNRLKGTANVYWAPFATVNKGIYAWNADLTDDLMHFNGRHYLAPCLEQFTSTLANTHIPNDWEDHTYYISNNVLYYCDKSGKPGTGAGESGVRFAYRGTTAAVFSPSNVSTRSFHKINNPHFYAGRNAGSTGATVFQQSMTTTTVTNNQYLNGYLLYDWGATLGDLGNGDLWQNLVIIFTPGSAYTLRVAGNSGYTNTAKVYNCVIHGGTNTFTLQSYGRLDVKNTAFLDCAKPYAFTDGNYTLSETNNLYGLTRLGSRNQVQIVDFVPTNGVVVEGDPGYSVSAFKDTDLVNKNFRPLSGSLALNAGAVISGRTLDLDGKAMVGLPDIGAYEFLPRKANHYLEMEV